jgi:GT2 family glycosyltransferase
MKPQLSICVPSYNSLEYLKILHRGLKRNTRLRYELIVHDNGSEDDTWNWCLDNGIKTFRSADNLGFTGVNNALKMADGEYVMIMNTDMYPLPGWDIELWKQIHKFKAQGIEKFTISCALIEPLGNNPEYVISYFGHDHETFKEEELVADYVRNRLTKYTQHNTTQYSHPILMPRRLMEEMWYLDEKYFPGWSVDHDLAAAAYEAGCRNFIMLTSSRVYHFISKTFTKLPKDVKNKDGQDIFQNKWKMSVDEFRKKLGIARPFKQAEEGILP